MPCARGSQVFSVLPVLTHSHRTALNYHVTVTFDSVVRELFVRMPDLEPIYQERFSYLAGENLPYVVFGSFLIPVLEGALEAHDTERVTSICAYLEEAAANASTDARLGELLRVEVGEWLNATAVESDIAPHLGHETKRTSGYIPGLASQRTSIRAERERRNPIARLVNHIRGE